jgi:hypothetical protein
LVAKRAFRQRGVDKPWPADGGGAQPAAEPFEQRAGQAVIRSFAAREEFALPFRQRSGGGDANPDTSHRSGPLNPFHLHAHQSQPVMRAGGRTEQADFQLDRSAIRTIQSALERQRAGPGLSQLLGKLLERFLDQPFNPRPLPGRLVQATIQGEWRRCMVGTNPFGLITMSLITMSLITMSLITMSLIVPQGERRTEPRGPTGARQRSKLLDPFHA